MKLIDLLVKELPKRGGWPGMATHAWSAIDGEIRFRNGGCKPDFYPAERVDSEDRIPSVMHEDDPRYIVTRSQYEAALAKNDGWIEWGGGERPVDGESIVDVKQRDNWTSEGYSAKCWKWNHVGDYADIIAYRLHRDINSLANDDRLEQDLNECIGQDVDMPEWSGEGLPPVGVKCEVRVGRDNYEECMVLYSGEHGCAFTYLGDNGDNHSIDCVSKHAAHDYFRPLRTEAEKKRDEAIEFIREIIDAKAGDPFNSARFIYECMMGGNIPGVKLESK